MTRTAGRLIVRAIALALALDFCGALFGASVSSAPLVAAAAVVLLDAVLAWCVWPLIRNLDQEPVGS